MQLGGPKSRFWPFFQLPTSSAIFGYREVKKIPVVVLQQDKRILNKFTTTTASPKDRPKPKNNRQQINRRLTIGDPK
jgi:hypothetical protein